MDEGQPTRTVSMTVNGDRITDEVEPRVRLTDFLRRRRHVDVRVGCEHGACGACSVIMDGDLIKSCMLYAVQADGTEITTAAGIVGDEDLGVIGRAFTENHALQCGFCTSGFVVATRALLDENPTPDRGEIIEGLSDNICRCTGYENIVDAVRDAAEAAGGR